jgi:hypothetical protein
LIGILLDISVLVKILNFKHKYYIVTQNETSPDRSQTHLNIWLVKVKAGVNIIISGAAFVAMQ